MGMFDSVYVECPKCGKEVEFQSKAGDCELKRFHPDSVPPEVAVDLSGDSQQCECGTTITLEYPECRPRVTMRVRTEGTWNWD